MEENGSPVGHANRAFTDAKLGLLREGLEYGPGGTPVRSDTPWAVGVDDDENRKETGAKTTGHRVRSAKSTSFHFFLSRFSLVNLSINPQSGHCPFCGKLVDLDSDNGEFRDELSRRECHISGLCQSCQDIAFGVQAQDSARLKAEVYIPYI